MVLERVEQPLLILPKKSDEVSNIVVRYLVSFVPGEGEYDRDSGHCALFVEKYLGPLDDIFSESVDILAKNVTEAGFIAILAELPTAVFFSQASGCQYLAKFPLYGLVACVSNVSNTNILALFTY